MLVQLRLKTGLTSDEYVTRQAWREATLSQCPLHPRGGCGFARHGTYGRKRPAGTRIARWYCRQGHGTFSLLPDHLAARFPASPGMDEVERSRKPEPRTLADLERVVAGVEQASSLERAADHLRSDDITLPNAIRWTQRRVRQVHALLTVLVGLLPALFTGCAPTVLAFRACLGGEDVLLRLRDLADLYLAVLPRPLGFHAGRSTRAALTSCFALPRPSLDSGEQHGTFQHDRGPDPPAADR